jgi:hypothetical protein
MVLFPNARPAKMMALMYSLFKLHSQYYITQLNLWHYYFDNDKIALIVQHHLSIQCLVMAKVSVTTLRNSWFGSLIG